MTQNTQELNVVRHLKQIWKVNKLDQWLPHELIGNQKFRSFEISSKYLQRNDNDPFPIRIIRCACVWVCSRSNSLQKLFMTVFG